MKCQNCGKELTDKAKFCTGCGTKTEQIPEVQPTTNNIFSHNLSNAWPDWEIEKQLGKGSYGVVYQAVHRENEIESRAAVKIVSIPSDYSEIDALLAKGLSIEDAKNYFRSIVDGFVGEICLMESLKGTQNIVSIEDYKVVEKTNSVGWDVYIRMELLTPFSTYIEDKSLTEAEVIGLGMEVCNALEMFASRNIIHRDIKPENIFVNDSGSFKLSDFGINRKLENLGEPKSNDDYIAPEVAMGAGYDSRVDTYSLGLVLYYLLNNKKLPFIDSDDHILSQNERRIALDRRIRGEALPAPCAASPAMANLILRSCSHNPGARFASASEMKGGLASVANGTYTIVNVASYDATSYNVVPNNNIAPDAAPTNIMPPVGDYNAAEDSPTIIMEVPQTENTPAEPPKTEKEKKKEAKEKKNGKKAKIIILSIVFFLLALAIALGVLFFRSSAYSVYKKMEDEKFEDAVSEYKSDMEENFFENLLLDILLEDRVEKTLEEYKKGDTEYDDAIEELDALDKLGFDGAEENRTKVMSLEADEVVTKYEKGEIIFDRALNDLLSIEKDGYSDARSLIEEITASHDADKSFEKADEFYQNGEYASAIAEYSKIPQSNKNYEKAQSKLNQVYKDYLNSIVETVKTYNSSKEFIKSIQFIESVSKIFPKDMDISELDYIKEETLTNYKAYIATQVEDLGQNNKWAEALDLIEDAINFNDNEDFRNLKTSTQEKFVKSVSSEVQKLLNLGDIAGAKELVENAIALLPNNADLKALKEKAENTKPSFGNKVSGEYLGEDGTHLIIYRDGTCQYNYDGNGSKGSWYIVDDVLYMNIDYLGYEIYAYIDDFQNEMLVESDSYYWSSEYFYKVTD